LEFRGRGPGIWSWEVTWRNASSTSKEKLSYFFGEEGYRRAKMGKNFFQQRIRFVYALLLLGKKRLKKKEPNEGRREGPTNASTRGETSYLSRKKKRREGGKKKNKQLFTEGEAAAKISWENKAIAIGRKKNVKLIY